MTYVDNEPICLRCGDEVCLRDGTEHTGWCDSCAQQSTIELLAAAKQARDHLKPDLVEPGRTVFWKLVETINRAEGKP